jgi:hypothetical protein
MRTNSLIIFITTYRGYVFTHYKKSTNEVIEAFKTELISRKDEFQVLNIENIMNNIRQFPKIKDVLEVAKADTIISKFQLANEKVKTKVKRYL